MYEGLQTTNDAKRMDGWIDQFEKTFWQTLTTFRVPYFVIGITIISFLIVILVFSIGASIFFKFGTITNHTRSWNPQQKEMQGEFTLRTLKRIPEA